ncbi:MAG: hypothetical protein EBY20_05255 [Alphaproteobacteria bacterium]|uniref:Protein kinase domain-containing protein n=1 Tax=viral metagenome TaxID=1070528 RepID=A0A6C0HR75_9ZZZZ|nr:hypothetical protein [Alphaproteobacteria bacterium]
MSITCVSKFNYKLHLNSSSNDSIPLFLKSILHMIPNLGGAIIKSVDGYCLDFCAHSVQKITDFKEQLNYGEVISMLYCLNKQHSFLCKIYNYGLFYLDLKDIVVIDSSIFVCINPEGVKNVNSVGEFSFYAPFSRNSKSAFFSPELLALDKIPSAVDCKCFYYSLGALAIYCLFGKNIKGLDVVAVKHVLNPIYQTKLYWMLLKATDSNCEIRNLIYI